MVKAETLESLPPRIYIPFGIPKATMDKYNADAEAGTDTEFPRRRTAFRPITAPFYAVPSTIVRYKTNGGLDINANCEVMDRGKYADRQPLRSGRMSGPDHTERQRRLRRRHARRPADGGSAQEGLIRTSQSLQLSRLVRVDGGLVVEMGLSEEHRAAPFCAGGRNRR